jgi:predicted ATPase/DNA-binding SARP family transcriptional activator
MDRMPKLSDERRGSSEAAAAGDAVIPPRSLDNETVRVELLGPLRVLVAGVEVPISAPKERAVVAILALGAGRTVRAEELISGLWEDNPPPSARKIVQTYVSALRRRLDVDLIQTVPTGYRLSIHPGAIDVSGFERHIHDGRSAAASGHHHLATESLLVARALWRGAPLTDLGDGPAAISYITRLTEMAKAGEEDLADARLAMGEHADIIGELEAAVAAEPLRERRWAQLMLALYRSGRQADALRAFGRLRKHLGEELGIAPSPELVALEEAIVLQGKDLDWSGSGLAGPETAGLDSTDTSIITNVLPSPTPLIGRSPELALAVQLLTDHRLVTLVGAGGSGKTRVGTEVAVTCKNLMADGVCWVGLQTVTASDLVMPAIAQALGARSDIATHIGSRQVLIVLDNFEQVIEAAPAVAELLAHTPGLRVLVTSREPLRVAGEHLLPIGPLPERDAVTLFVERATAENPTFRAGPSVVAISRRLDGLPLALELAAARVSFFTLDDLLAHLDRALPILASQRRDVPDRQRTLEATIRWSYDLLPETQQHILRRLSPLDSFDLEAATFVSGASIDLLHSLLDKSLLRRVGDDRLQMLQTVREFCLDRLDESGESRAAHGALLTYASKVLDEVAASLHGCDQPIALARLDFEYGNLRAAAQWAVHNDLGAAARLAIGLGWYWLLRNRLNEGLALMQGVYEEVDQLPDRTRAAVLGSYGRLLYYRGEAAHSFGDTCGARDILLRGEEEWRKAASAGVFQSDELIERIATLVYLGIASGSSGERELTRQAGDEAIAAGDATGEPWCIGLAYWGLGTNLFLDRCDANHPDEARHLLERAAGHLRQAGDYWALGGPLLYLGRQLLRTGDTAGAYQAGSEALHCFQTSGEKWRTALALRHLANVASARRQESVAVALGEQADQLERELGRLATVPAPHESPHRMGVRPA